MEGMEARAARDKASLQRDGQGPPGSPLGEVHQPEYQPTYISGLGRKHPRPRRRCLKSLSRVCESN